MTDQEIKEFRHVIDEIISKKEWYEEISNISQVDLMHGMGFCGSVYFLRYNSENFTISKINEKDAVKKLVKILDYKDISYNINNILFKWDGTM
tara:strand:+ start:12 stop:290 length:279 start_codon:yes stop_codon:yes gene_type:complete